MSLDDFLKYFIWPGQLVNASEIVSEQVIIPIHNVRTETWKHDGNLFEMPTWL